MTSLNALPPAVSKQELSKALGVKPETAPAPEPTKNVLGGLHGGESPLAKLDVSLFQLVQEFGPTSLATKDEIKRLDGAHDERARLQKVSDDHSLPVIEQKIRAKGDEYMQKPSRELMDELRHLRSLDSFTATQTQFCAVRQQKEAAAAVSDISKKILRKAAELCDQAAKDIDEHDRTLAAKWGVAFVRSPIAAALARRAQEFRNEAACQGPLTHIPELANQLCD